VETARAPAIAALARTIVPAILHAVLSLILSLILGLTLSLILALILTLILALSLPAALPLILDRPLILDPAPAPPVVEVVLAALAGAEMAGVRGRACGAPGAPAHHNPRRKQHGRLQHGSRPRWSSAITTREPALGSLSRLCVPALRMARQDSCGSCVPSPVYG